MTWAVAAAAIATKKFHEDAKRRILGTSHSSFLF